MFINKLLVSNSGKVLLKLSNLKLPNRGLIGIRTSVFSKAKILLYTLAGLTEFFPELNFEIAIEDMPKLEDIQLLVEYPETQISGLKDYVESEIALPLEERCKNIAFIIKRIKEISQEIQIKNILHKKLFHLSTGEIQKTVLSSILITRPKLLLMMHPFSGLDFRSKEILLKYLKQQQETLSIFFDLEDITYSISDFILDLDRGTFTSCNQTKIYEQFMYPTFFSKKEKDAYKKGKIIYLKFLQYKEKKDAIISINNLTFSFKNENKEVIKNFSLEAYLGDKILVIGKNGSGKTTLAKIICGFLKAYKGSVTVKGHPFFIPTDPTNLFLYSSVFEEVRNSKIGKETSDNWLKHILTELELYDKKDKSPVELEMEDKKKLALALAIATKAEIVIIDEPTNFTSAKFREKLIEILNKFMGNRVVIIITHDTKLIDELVKCWKGNHELYCSD